MLARVGLLAQAGASAPALTLPTTSLLAAWDARAGTMEIDEGSGLRVASWLASTGQDLVQSADASRPTIHPSGVGGKPALLFDGVDDRLSLTGLSAAVSHTIHIVFSSAGAINSRALWDFQTGRYLCLATSTGFLINDAVTTLAATTAYSGARVLTLVSQSGGNRTFFLDGVQISTSAYANRALNGVFSLASNWVGGQNAPISVAQVAVYSAAQDAGALADVWAYQNQEWGVA